MTPPLTLDFDALLAPIAGDSPCGLPVPYEVRQKLEDGRKEDSPDDYAPDDPARPDAFKKADWRGIAQLAGDTLGRSSKDLLVAARLTEALTRLHGFVGLRDGLRLMRELVEQWWDQLYPPIEDGDLERRTALFRWLDDATSGALFPNTIRMAPLLAAYGWHHWRQSQDPKGTVPREDFEKALREASAEACARTAEEVNQAAEELEKLRQALDARMGPAAPVLTAAGSGLRQAVADCQTLAGHILEQKRPAGGAEPDTSAEVPASSPQSSVTRAITTRDEAYRQLAQAAAVLQRLEPHSPIPYLVRKAVELGALSFPELIVRLIRDEGVLTELNRELGLKPQGEDR